MSRLIQTNSKSWGESLQFAHDLPALGTHRDRPAPRRWLWFALGLMLGLALATIG
jgi:hypothetical protein